MGYLINKHKSKPIQKTKNIIILICAVILFALQPLEHYLLKIGPLEMYFTTFISCILFVIFFTSMTTTNFGQWFYKYFGDKSYFIVYIFHLMIGWLIFDKMSPILTCVVTFIVCMLINEGYVLTTYLFNKIKDKKKIENQTPSNELQEETSTLPENNSNN